MTKWTCWLLIFTKFPFLPRHNIFLLHDRHIVTIWSSWSASTWQKFDHQARGSTPPEGCRHHQRCNLNEVAVINDFSPSTSCFKSSMIYLSCQHLAISGPAQLAAENSHQLERRGALHLNKSKGPGGKSWGRCLKKWRHILLGNLHLNKNNDPGGIF